MHPSAPSLSFRRQSRFQLERWSLRAAFFFLLFAICLLTITSSSVANPGAVWKRQRASSLAWLHSVFFLDHNRGWAVGSRGTLLSTQDGGKSWLSEPSPTEDAIRDVHFTDEQNGVLVCERNIYDLKSNEEPRAYLMKTTDGGAQWKRLNMRGAEVDARIMRAVFSRGGRGWVFGEGGAVYVTSNGGESWLRLQAPTRYLLLGGAFVDENTGWLVGAGSTILRTSDGGESWRHSPVANALNVRFNAASFIDSRFGWAVGSGGSIYRTINGGRSWQRQNSGVATDLYDVKFLDAAEGWAVGEDGTLLHTMNGGIRWIEEPSGTSHTLQRIFFTDRLHGWAVGFGGTIISYGSGHAPKLKR